jgi:hypothetical protein
MKKKSIFLFLLFTFYAIYAIYSDPLEDIYVPTNVSVVYVIIQKPGPLVDGSSELLSLDSRDEFLANFSKYIDIAKSKKMRLIITAATSGEQQWVHNKFKYKGFPLKPTTYRDPNQSKSFPGAEIPL